MEAIYKMLSTLGYTKAAIIILLLGIFIDITPGIKLNPIKALFRYLGKSFNASVENDIKDMKGFMSNQIDKIQSEQVAQREVLNKLIVEKDDSDISRMRWEIINCSDEIVNEGKHSRSQYLHVLSSFEEYNRLMSKTENKNNRDDYFHLQVQQAGKRIQDHYEKFKDTNYEYF